jgi:hypothetical protein
MILELEVPSNWKRFRLPRPLERRLQELLDRQDEVGRLSVKERREAEALADISELLSYLKLQAKFKRKRSDR